MAAPAAEDRAVAIEAVIAAHHEDVAAIDPTR
jgi:hypothetical protein